MAPSSDTLSDARPRVNDFSIEVATVNGSGSQTANTVLLRAIFQSGVPVSGKNLFPSNISGLPTWFQIRASARGYAARKRDVDLMVCMNPESAQEDVARLPAGALLVYDEPLALEALRGDLRPCPVPFQALLAASCPEPRLHKLVKNMVYVGVVASLADLDPAEVDAAIGRVLEGKEKAIALNRAAARAGYDWARAHLPVGRHLRVARAEGTRGRILVDGNTACALGALFAGVSVVGWYPITPSTSLVDRLAEYAERYRVDPATGARDLAILQMEDELAAAGVVVGAGWAGARALTATSGPGISLMSELIGLGHWAECPGVFVDVQRSGPSTGLPTRTQQGDVELCARASHGDTLHINLYPATMEECFAFTYQAFDLAERFQTPVMVVSDLDLGMQTWVSEPFNYPEAPLDRGKVLDPEQLAALQDWGRYKDLDGDGIPWRTLPGTPGGRGAYFARGSGHNAHGGYSEKPADYQALLDRLKRKHQEAAGAVPAPVLEGGGSAEGLLAYGSSHPAVREARDMLAERHGRRMDYLRLRALPFTRALEDFLAAHDVVHVVEQNRDGQMAGLLKQAYPELAGRLRSVLHYDGTSLPAEGIVEAITGGKAPSSSTPPVPVFSQEVRP